MSGRSRTPALCLSKPTGDDPLRLRPYRWLTGRHVVDDVTIDLDKGMGLETGWSPLAPK